MTGTQQPTDKHDHHTAPRYYLKAWCIRNERAFLWEYHRGTPYNPGLPGHARNPVKRALRKASVQIDHYGKYEDEITKREEHAKPVIEKLRTTQHEPRIAPAEKTVLTDYLDLFIKRTTARDERLPDVWNTVKQTELPKLDQAIKDFMNLGRFTDALRLEEERRKYEQQMPDDIRQQTILLPSQRVRARILELHWTFLTAPTTVFFITSDNPVRYPEHEGLSDDHAFLTFPISTTLTLFASTTGFATLFDLPTATIDCGTAAATEHQATVLNHLTITGANQYLYSQTASEELTKTFG